MYIDDQVTIDNSNGLVESIDLTQPVVKPKREAFAAFGRGREMILLLWFSWIEEV